MQLLLCRLSRGTGSRLRDLLDLLGLVVRFSVKVAEQVDEDDDIGEEEVGECFRHAAIHGESGHQVNEHHAELDLEKVKFFVILYLPYEFMFIPAGNHFSLICETIFRTFSSHFMVSWSKSAIESGRKMGDFQEGIVKINSQK